MGNLHNTDAGLQYIQSIGLERIKNFHAFKDKLIMAYGNKGAEKIYKEWVAVPPGSKELYEFKALHPELCEASAEYYDLDIIRKGCNYIDAHKEYFGETILEVGCDAGYITSFLAKEFPNAKIVAIDRCETAINLAKTRMQELGIQNVEFRHASIEDISEKFDTILCMRVVQENIDYSIGPYFGEPLAFQIGQYADLMREFMKQMIARLKENGNICYIERIDHNQLMVALLAEMCNQKCAPLFETLEAYECKELNRIDPFHGVICKNGTEGDQQKIIQDWFKSPDVTSTEGKVTGVPALALLQANAGKLLRGVRVINPSNYTVGRYAIFEDKNKKPIVYYLCGCGGSIELIYVEESAKDYFFENLEEVINTNTQAGLRCEEINPDDEWLEGNK